MKNIFLSFMLLLAPLAANTFTTPDMAPLWHVLDELGPGDLVVFDVDWTLIEPCDTLLRPEGQQLRHKLWKQHFAPLSPQEKDNLLSKILLQRKIALIDPSIISLICQLKARGVTVMAETALRPGTLGHIQSLQEWRYSELCQLGISFKGAFGNQAPFFLRAFTNKRGDHPLFEKGILYSAHLNKGEVLLAFLKQVDFCPKRVFFFDDRQQNVDAVNEALTKAKIPISSYLYQETLECPKKIDEETANEQLLHLLQTGIWLTDNQAQEQLRPSLSH